MRWPDIIFKIPVGRIEGRLIVVEIGIGHGAKIRDTGFGMRDTRSGMPPIWPLANASSN
jgi:hypothetical protein